MNEHDEEGWKPDPDASRGGGEYAWTKGGPGFFLTI